MGRKDDFVNIPMEKKDYLINLDYELIKIGENRAEERCKRRIAELEKYRMFFESCSCYFAEGVEFMTKDEIYEAIQKETKQLECDKWEAK